MTKILKIVDPIFTQHFYVIFAKNAKEYKNILKRDFGIKDYGSIDDSDDGAVTVYKNYKKYQYAIFIFLASEDADLITHECFHATCDALERFGFVFSKETEELYAHYLGYLVRIITKEQKNDRKRNNSQIIKVNENNECIINRPQSCIDKFGE